MNLSQFDIRRSLTENRYFAILLDDLPSIKLPLTLPALNNRHIEVLHDVHLQAQIILDEGAGQLAFGHEVAEECCFNHGIDYLLQSLIAPGPL